MSISSSDKNKEKRHLDTATDHEMNYVDFEKKKKKSQVYVLY